MEELLPPWYELGREKMGEPWRPQLSIEKNGRSYTFRYGEQTEKVREKRAAKRFAELIRNPPYYVRDRESSRLFSYLQHCYFNGMVPDGTDFESITDRCGY